MRKELKQLLPKLKTEQLDGLVFYELSIAQKRHQSIEKYIQSITLAAAKKKSQNQALRSKVSPKMIPLLKLKK